MPRCQLKIRVRKEHKQSHQTEDKSVSYLYKPKLGVVSPTLKPLYALSGIFK